VGYPIQDMFLLLLFSSRLSHVVCMNLLFLSPARNSTTRPLPGSCVRAGSLPSNRKRLTVSEASITSQFHQSFDIHRDCGTQLSLHLVLTVNDLSNRCDLVFSEIVRLCIEVYTNLLQYLPRCAASDPVDVG
jgi:hypothetical protein